VTPRHLSMAAALVAAAMCAACSGTGSGTGTQSAPHHSAAATSHSTPGASLRLTTVKVLRDANVGPAAFNQAGDVVWPESSSITRGNLDRVSLLRTGSSTPVQVAHSAWSAGFINWVAFAGPWVIYVDQSAEQGDTAPNVDWVIHADNIDTQQHLVLSKSPHANPWVPNIYAGDGGVVFATASPSRRADLWRWVPGTPVSAITKVLSDTELSPDSLTPTKDGVVYLGPNGAGKTQHTLGGDCWIAPYDGSAPRVLTHTALGMSCAVGGDTLVYSLHIDPSQTKPEDMADDPYEIWTEPLDGSGKPQRIEQGYTQTRPLVGKTFATWVDTKGRQVATFDGIRQLVTPDVDASGYDMGAEGDTYAVDVRHDHGPTTIKLVTVSPTP
jgi:hypothetical protein